MHIRSSAQVDPSGHRKPPRSTLLGGGSIQTIVLVLYNWDPAPSLIFILMYAIFPFKERKSIHSIHSYRCQRFDMQQQKKK